MKNYYLWGRMILDKLKNMKSMSDKNVLEVITMQSEKIFNFWKDPYGWAPDNSTKLLTVAKFDWLLSLTKCLDIWITKNIFMTTGELLIARTNLGSLVEGWLKIFYCIYYNDYLNDAKKKLKKNGQIVTPNNLSFEELRQFSIGKLWEKNNKWVLSIQQKRNAIHSVNDRDIGNIDEFIKDIQQ